MRSTIYLSDTMTNADRAFGSSDSYIPIVVVSESGAESVGFLTRARVEEAVARAAKNPEDVARVHAARRLREEVEGAASSRTPLVIVAAFVLVFLVAVAIAAFLP